MRNGTPMQRLRDRRKFSPAPERIAAFAAREIEQSAEDVVGIIGGTRSLVALNVGGVVLAEDGALTPGVVTTEAIAENAVTEAAAPAVTAGTIDCKSTSPVTIQSKTVAVAEGESVELLGFCSLVGLAEGVGTTGQVVSAGYVALYRGADLLIEIPAQFLVRNVSITSPGMVPWIDEPSAGSHTYALKARVASTSDVTTFSAQARYLAARVFKR